LIALLFWRCNEPSPVIETLRFNEVAIPNNLKTDITNGRVSSQDIDIEEIEVKVVTDEGKEIIGKMRFTIPIGEDNTLINFEMTNNIFQQTDLTPNFWIDYANNMETEDSRVANETADCLQGCNGYNRGGGRGGGRGACKFGNSSYDGSYCYFATVSLLFFNANLAIQVTMVAIAISQL